MIFSILFKRMLRSIKYSVYQKTVGFYGLSDIHSRSMQTLTREPPSSRHATLDAAYRPSFLGASATIELLLLDSTPSMRIRTIRHAHQYRSYRVPHAWHHQSRRRYLLRQALYRQSQRGHSWFTLLACFVAAIRARSGNDVNHI